MSASMRRSLRPTLLFPALLTSLIATAPAPAWAGTGQGSNWSQVKCARYTKAWSDALARLGGRGLSRDFLDRHAAFVASGCTARAEVCPRSPEELERANVMTIAAMNAGTASTFLPFACPR